MAAVRSYRGPALLATTALVVGLVVGVPHPGHAETVAVDTTTDTADPDARACEDPARPCTLRDAVSAANTSDDHTTIALPAGTYEVTEGSLDVVHDLSVVGLDDDVVLDGPDASLFAVDGAAARSTATPPRKAARPCGSRTRPGRGAPSRS